MTQTKWLETITILLSFTVLKVTWAQWGRLSAGLGIFPIVVVRWWPRLEKSGDLPWALKQLKLSFPHRVSRFLVASLCPLSSRVTDFLASCLEFLSTVNVSRESKWKRPVSLWLGPKLPECHPCHIPLVTQVRGQPGFTVGGNYKRVWALWSLVQSIGSHLWELPIAVCWRLPATEVKMSAWWKGGKMGQILLSASSCYSEVFEENIIFSCFFFNGDCDSREIWFLIWWLSLNA